MDCVPPAEGVNFSGPWHKGKKAADGSDIPLAHKNARYTVALHALANCDAELENPDGVALSGVMYGGRDARSYVPVQQSYDWQHGIITYGASLETETTFAILGQEGVPEINLMSIQDFVAIQLGKYIQNNLDFGKKLTRPPFIFGVNYFLKGQDGKFLNRIEDKHVWVKWMELRVHGDVGAIESPTGLIPVYEDLRGLFREHLGRDYAREEYEAQFTVRIEENLEKVKRIETFYRVNVHDAPDVLYHVLDDQRKRLLKAKG